MSDLPAAAQKAIEALEKAAANFRSVRLYTFANEQGQAAADLRSQDGGWRDRQAMRKKIARSLWYDLEPGSIGWGAAARADVERYEHAAAVLLAMYFDRSPPKPEETP